MSSLPDTTKIASLPLALVALVLDHAAAVIEPDCTESHLRMSLAAWSRGELLVARELLSDHAARERMNAWWKFFAACDAIYAMMMPSSGGIVGARQLFKLGQARIDGHCDDDIVYRATVEIGRDEEALGYYQDLSGAEKRMHNICCSVPSAILHAYMADAYFKFPDNGQPMPRLDTSEEPAAHLFSAADSLCEAISWHVAPPATADLWDNISGQASVEAQVMLSRMNAVLRG